MKIAVIVSVFGLFLANVAKADIGQTDYSAANTTPQSYYSGQQLGLGLTGTLTQIDLYISYAWGQANQVSLCEIDGNEMSLSGWTTPADSIIDCMDNGTNRLADWYYGDADLNPDTDPTIGMIETSLEWRRKDNDAAEENGEHSYFAIIGEEFREIFTAKTREERHTEIVQAIALLVRLDEDEAI